MGLITRDQLIGFILETGGFTREQVEGFVNYRSFKSLRVDQLKQIFKRLESFGYHSLNRNVNKPVLIQQFQDFVGSYSEKDGLFHAPNEVINETPQPPRTPASTSYTPAQAAPAPLVPPQAKHVGPSHLNRTAQPVSINNTPHPPAPSRTTSWATPSSSSSAKRSLSQLSKPEMAIYRELSEIDGITAADVIAALDDCPPLQRNANSILMLIIEKKQREEGPTIAPPQSKEQEDADLDRAILESEQERDRIQERKRKRISTILEDTDLEILSASEFKRSVFLHGLPAQYHPSPHHLTPPSSSSSSSSSSSCPFPSSSNASSSAIHTQSDGGDVTSHIIVRGSQMIRGLSQMLDQHYASQRKQKTSHFVDLCSSSSSSEETMYSLREAVVRLLLIEFDALKYYGEVCFPYLLSLSETFDKQFLNHASRYSGLSDSSKEQEEVREVLQRRKEEFEKGLFKMVKDGEGVPALFRKNYLKPYYQLLSHRLDSDGFELVGEQKEAVKFVEDVSEEEIEEEDEDDYDD